MPLFEYALQDPFISKTPEWTLAPGPDHVTSEEQAEMVRDFIKWDDAPQSLGHFAESAVRAYTIAMTPPQEPVVLVADAVLQEEPISEKNLRIPKLVVSAPPQGDTGAVAEAAQRQVSV